MYPTDWLFVISGERVPELLQLRLHLCVLCGNDDQGQGMNKNNFFVLKTCKKINLANKSSISVICNACFMQVLAKGLVIGQHAYLKSGWNVMDGFLVGISLVDILISLSADSSPRIFGILRVFRLLRTLRPLR